METSSLHDSGGFVPVTETPEGSRVDRTGSTLFDAVHRASTIAESFESFEGFRLVRNWVGLCRFFRDDFPSFV